MVINMDENNKIFRKKEKKSFTISLQSETVDRIRYLRRIAESKGDTAYKSLDNAIFHWLIEQEKHYNIKRSDHQKSLICPKCGGVMQKRKGKTVDFLGCSNYPNCKHTQNIDL